MLKQAEEQLRQYDMPRPVHDVKGLRREVADLKEKNREQACQIAQLQTQLEVQTVATQHLKEQLSVKDQMLSMQEEMLSQLSSEVEKLKQMLLLKDNF